MFNNLLNNFSIQKCRLTFRKQFTLLFIFIFLIISYTNAQWIQQNSNLSVDLRSISFINVNTGWIIGENGTIIKTTNGGTTWDSLNSGTTQNLRSVKFVNENLGWIVGTDDILQTTNGGSNWTFQTSTPTTLNDVDFLNGFTGWAVGTVGRILYTTNGGTNWEQQTSGTMEHFLSADFIDSSKGWCVGSNGSIYYTQTQGQFWAQQNSGTTQDLYSVDFINANTGFTVGYNGTIIKTTNGGTNWELKNSGTTRDLFGIHFFDSSKGWCVGSSGRTFYTQTQAEFWAEHNTGVNKTLNDIQFPGGMKEYDDFSQGVIGYIAGDGGTILKTTDGGLFVNSNNNSIPDEFTLQQNYPNPFNPSTTITFDLPKSGFVSLIIYDVLGREVSILLNRKLTAGSYIGKWNAEEYNSGVYFYRLTAGDYVETRKMLLVK